jgi:hypothetical protein
MTSSSRTGWPTGRRCTTVNNAGPIGEVGATDWHACDRDEIDLIAPSGCAFVVPHEDRRWGQDQRVGRRRVGARPRFRTRRPCGLVRFSETLAAELAGGAWTSTQLHQAR